MAMEGRKRAQCGRVVMVGGSVAIHEDGDFASDTQVTSLVASAHRLILARTRMLPQNWPLALCMPGSHPCGFFGIGCTQSAWRPYHSADLCLS